MRTVEPLVGWPDHTSISSARTPWSSWVGIGSACSPMNQPGAPATDIELCEAA